jgi:hypothetical protein
LEIQLEKATKEANDKCNELRMLEEEVHVEGKKIITMLHGFKWPYFLIKCQKVCDIFQNCLWIGFDH